MNPVEFLPDMISNLTLAVAGIAPQVIQARQFIDQAQAAGSYSSITFLGHSLGGFLAQVATSNETEGEVVVFNAPGAGGFLGFPADHDLPSDNFTYVYSEDWNLQDGANLGSIMVQTADGVFDLLA